MRRTKLKWISTGCALVLLSTVLAGLRLFGGGRNDIRGGIDS